MKMYVLVRSDLSVSQQAVQAGHAVAELILHGLQKNWNKTLIYLRVKDEDELIRWKEKIEFRNKEYAEFREPDIGNQLTAIACVDDGKMFSKLSLL